MRDVDVRDDLEDTVRRFEGREYVVASYLNGSEMIQDYVSFPLIVPVDEVNDLPRSLVDTVMRNAKSPDASTVTTGEYRRVVITGDPGLAMTLDDDTSIIAIGRAVGACPASHAFITNYGPAMKKIAASIKGTIGIFPVTSEDKIISTWKMRSGVGVYRMPTGTFHPIRRLAASITTDLYGGDDPASAAIQYAVRHLRCKELILHACDSTHHAWSEGMVSVTAGRYIYPEHEKYLRVMHAVAYVAARNSVDVRYCPSSMAKVPGGTPIDKEEIQELIR